MFRPTNHLKAGGSVVARMLVVRGLTVALAGSTAIAFAQNSPNVPPGNLTPSQPGLLLPQPGNTNIGIPSQNIPGARELKKTGSDNSKKKWPGAAGHDSKKLDSGVARNIPDTKKRKTQTPATEAARISPLPRTVPDVTDDLAARTAVQWARIERGLSAETMEACRRVANNLAPRVGSLLNGPDWESRILTAIVSELKEAGVSYAKAEDLARESRDAKSRTTEGASKVEELDRGGEAESLRGEAANIKSSNSAASAALAVVGATAAAIPVPGQIIAAIAAIVTAVLVIIGQLNEQTEKDQAAAKEKEGGGSAAEMAERLRKMKLRLVMQMETHRDDELFPK